MDHLDKNGGNDKPYEILAGEKAEGQQQPQLHETETNQEGLKDGEANYGHYELSILDQDVASAGYKESFDNPLDAKDEKALKESGKDVRKKSEVPGQVTATIEEYEAVQQTQDDQDRSLPENKSKENNQAIDEDHWPPSQEAKSDECNAGKSQDTASSHAASAPGSGKAAAKHVNASDASKAASSSLPTAASSGETLNNTDDGIVRIIYEERGNATVIPVAKDPRNATSTGKHSRNILSEEPTPAGALAINWSTSGSTSSEIRSKKKKTLSARLSPSIANKEGKTDMDQHSASVKFPVRRQKARPAPKAVPHYNGVLQAVKPTSTSYSLTAKENKSRGVQYSSVPKAQDNSEQPPGNQSAKEPSIKGTSLVNILPDYSIRRYRADGACICAPDPTCTPPVETSEMHIYARQESGNVAKAILPASLSENQYRQNANSGEADIHRGNTPSSDRKPLNKQELPSTAKPDVRSQESESRSESGWHGRQGKANTTKKQEFTADVRSLGKMADASDDRYATTSAQLSPKRSTQMVRRAGSERLKQEPTRHRDLHRKASRRTLSKAHEHGGALKQHRSNPTVDSHQRNLPERHHCDSHDRRRSPASARSGSIRTSLVSLLLRSASILRHFAHRHAEPRLPRSGGALRTQRLRQSDKNDSAAEVQPSIRARDRASHRFTKHDSAQSKTDLRAHNDRQIFERRRNREVPDDLKGTRLRRDQPVLLRRRTEPYAPNDSRIDGFRPSEDVGSREKRQRSQHLRNGMEPLETSRHHHRRWSE
ncbi:hypothetical protein KEM54_004497 [Ascosphaera aggregata]|nr:hypothetical protein KEM54_004497 [Ascosphaera aggregata]